MSSLVDGMLVGFSFFFFFFVYSTYIKLKSTHNCHYTRVYPDHATSKWDFVGEAYLVRCLFG